MFWLLVILLILLVATLPTWPYSTRYGYGYNPSGVLAAALLVFLLPWLFGVFAVTI